MAEDLAGLRRQLALRLPDRIRAAIGGYETFAATVPPDDAKGFAAWHAAAKAALAHAEALVKLARWAEGGAAASDEAEGLDGVLARARAVLAGLEDEDDDSGDDQ